MTWQPRAHPRANPAMGRRLGLQTAWRAGAQAPLEADPGRRARARGQCPVRGPWRERPGLRGCCRRTSQGPPQLLPWRDRSSGAGRPALLLRRPAVLRGTASSLRC